jgi:hypothetical protein
MKVRHTKADFVWADADALSGQRNQVTHLFLGRPNPDATPRHQLQHAVPDLSASDRMHTNAVFRMYGGQCL